MTVSAELLDRVVKEVLASMKSEDRTTDPAEVVAGVSNRHVHLSRSDLNILFGSGYELSKLRDLRQPGQYACKEILNLSTGSGTIEKVRILGPVRDATQVELSATDARKLKIRLPLVKSGDKTPCSPLVLTGPCGAVVLESGVGIAWRHVHLTPATASSLELKDGDHVSIETGGARGVIFKDVWVRVSDRMDDEYHVDLDEANSCGLATGDMVRIVRS